MGNYFSKKPTKLARLIIRPPREEMYTTWSNIFQVHGVSIQKQDVMLPGFDGRTLVGSYFRGRNTPCNAPTIVYLHGNCGCLQECSFLFQHTIPYGMSVFSFDCSGSGRSEGRYIGLGATERYDLQAVVKYLSRMGITKIILWGYSMGAATCLMYTALPRRESCVKGIIVDSSFTSLRAVIAAIFKEIVPPLSLLKGVASATVMSKVRAEIKKLSGLDINDIDPLAHTARIEEPIPALFVHGEQDTTIPISQGKKLFDAYNGTDKTWIPMADHDHNCMRNRIHLEKMITFAANQILDGSELHLFLSQYPPILENRGLMCSNYYDSSIRSMFSRNSSIGYLGTDLSPSLASPDSRCRSPE